MANLFKSFLIFLLLSAPAFMSLGAVYTITDLSGATGLSGARIQGTVVGSAVDSVRYRHLTPRDTLVSGTHYRNNPYLFPSVWPTLMATAQNEFNISYLVYKDNVSWPGGNYWLEKRVTVDTANNRVNFFCQPYPNQARHDSAGYHLSRRISPPNGSGLIVGGVNTRSLLGPNKRVYRVCEAYGGGQDSVFVLDTAESGFGLPSNSFGTSLETGLLTSKTYPDFCINTRGDTIFAAYTPNGSGTQYLRVTPIRITGRDTVRKEAFITVLTSATDTRRDISIDRDSATGKFLIACLKNNSILELTATAANLSSPVSLDAQTGLPSISQISRNIRVAALGNQHFAVAYWLTLNGSGGVHLRIVDVSSGLAVVDSVVLEPNAGLVPSLSVRGNRLAAAWLKDTRPGFVNTGQIWGKVFSIENGLIADTLLSRALSGDSTITKFVNAAPGNFCTAVALDTTGSLVAAYAKQDLSIYLTAWAPLYYYKDTAYAEMEDSLSVAGWGSLAADSIIYSGFSAQNSGNGGQVELLFRSSASRTFLASFSGVTSGSTLGPLLGSHFQYRVRMIAGANAMTRPIVSSLSLVVNVKPRDARIDSFTVNNRAFQAVPSANDTVTVMARSDTLKIISSAADYDNALPMTLSLAGYALSNAAMSRDSARHYSRVSSVDPVDHRDTVYTLAMSVTDSGGWGSDTFKIRMKLRNPYPVMAVTDTVHLFGVKTGHSPSNGDTLRFMKRHKIVFRADFSDTNDPLTLTGRTYVNGALRHSYPNVQTLLDTLISADVPGDTALYSIAVSDPGGAVDSVSFTVIAYNRPPSLTASDTVYLFNAKTGHAPADRDTVRFMKRHKTVFRADFTDSNDLPALAGRTYVNGILRHAYVNAQSLLDTLFASDLPGDTAQYSITVTDSSAATDSVSFTVIAYNRPPVDSIRKQAFDAQSNPAPDALLFAGETLFVIESGYTVFRCFGRDSNETDLKHYFLFNGTKRDSASDTVYFADTLYADSLVGLATLGLVVRDSFAQDTVTFFARVSHLPHLDSVVYKRMRLTSDTSINITTGMPDTFTIYATDPDVILDDRLTYRMAPTTGNGASVTTNALSATFIHPPNRADKTDTLWVSDRSGAFETMLLRFLFPTFEKGPGFAADSIYFSDSIRVFVTRVGTPMNSISAESHAVKIMNTGTDTLVLKSAGFASNQVTAKWVKMGYAATGNVAPVAYAPVIHDTQYIAPDSSLFLWVRDSAAVAYGDSAGHRISQGNADTTIFDTLFLVTNDAERDTLRIPITLRCAEAPYVLNDSLIFLGDVPALPKGNGAKDYAPRNAAYREIAMVFSEPMAHGTAGASTFSVYSRADSLIYASGGADTVAPFPGTYRWSKASSGRFDTLFFSPALTSGNYVSRASGITAPDGFFVTADPVRVKVSSGLQDLAGNRMDLYNDFTPDTARAFKIYRGQVDSGSLTVASLTPEAGSEGAATQPLITIHFSSPLDPLSVDTAGTNNRTIRIRSTLSPSGNIGLLNGVNLLGNTLSFTPAAKFYSGDSVVVTLASSLRDLYRNTLDGNRDGRGGFFYAYGYATYAMADTFITDSAASAGDNYTFHFWTAREDFYFYPCPYEPGRNARHQALGGIVFKNLHSLLGKGKSGAVQVRIYNVSGDLVYSTGRKSEGIQFGQEYGALSKPQWTWSVTNNNRQPVGSGLYLFVISDRAERNVLNRGKLIVIR